MKGELCNMLKLKNINRRPDSVAAYTLYGNSCYCGGTCVCSTRCDGITSIQNSGAAFLDYEAGKDRDASTD